MSEPRKNHLNIDGAVPKEEERVDSYKAIPESDQEFRTSKSSLGKSREKVTDPAQEKLLDKEDEARIVSVVMDADAKYVVGDHRNGDAKVELDANKRQFSGLTKEELLKYADDPFWVRVRWLMFVLFWALWLAMLAGAVAIIVRAPKCDSPPAKTWYEIGPLVDMSSESAVDYQALEDQLPLLEEAKVKGIFINPCEDTYEVLDSDACVDSFKQFLVKANERSIKVIVDLTANFVSMFHPWFRASENGTEEFAKYFTWADGNGFDDKSEPNPPNNWVSRYDEPAWSWSVSRKQFYLHQFRGDQPDLNFHLEAVVQQFDRVLGRWMAAGAHGVRLQKARQLVVNETLKDESPNPNAVGAVHGTYHFLAHSLTADQPRLGQLLARWANIVAEGDSERVFTIAEDGTLSPEYYRVRGGGALRPPLAAPRALPLPALMPAFANDLNEVTSSWVGLQLSAADADADVELALFSMLLAATPILRASQIPPHDNDTLASERFSKLAELREVPTVKYGASALAALSPSAPLLAVNRWRPNNAGAGYVAVFNPSSSRDASADLTALPPLPAALQLQHASRAVHRATGYVVNQDVPANNVTVPAHSTVVLTYTHEAAATE